jgi:putative transposase
MEVTKKEERGENKEIKRPQIDSAIIEELMKGYEQPADLTGPGGIMEELHKRLYERVLGAELTHHLGYGKGEAPERAEGQRRESYRNGSSKKTLLSEDGKLEIDIARDRTGEFEPRFIRKGQKRFGGFDSKIIAMYAQGMTVREIKRFPGRAIQSGSLRRSDQHRDRFGPGRRHRVAKPALGADVRGGLLRRLEGQNPGRRDG